MDGFLSWIGKAASIFANSNYLPKPAHNFQTWNYDPLYGRPVIGDKIDHPGIALKTNFIQRSKDLDRLNGRLDTHFVGSALYQEAWKQHKMANFNQPMRFLDPYFNGVVAHRELRYMDGTHVSSRDPYLKRKPQQMYNKVRGDKQRL